MRRCRFSYVARASQNIRMRRNFGLTEKNSAKKYCEGTYVSYILSDILEYLQIFSVHRVLYITVEEYT